LDKKDIAPEKKVGERCPECGKPLVERFGKFGKFIACTGYPECKYSRPLETKEEKKNAVVAENGETEKVSDAEGERCEKCKGKMILKEGKFGKFLACENYPKCKNTKTIVVDTKIKCPECDGGSLVERRTRKGRHFWGCSHYPDCKYATWNDPTNTDKKNQNSKSKDQN